MKKRWRIGLGVSGGIGLPLLLLIICSTACVVRTDRTTYTGEATSADDLVRVKFLSGPTWRPGRYLLWWNGVSGTPFTPYFYVHLDDSVTSVRLTRIKALSAASDNELWDYSFRSSPVEMIAGDLKLDRGMIQQYLLGDELGYAYKSKSDDSENKIDLEKLHGEAFDVELMFSIETSEGEAIDVPVKVNVKKDRKIRWGLHVDIH